MPVSSPSSSSCELKERLKILRPYIIWRRRKRQINEARLLQEIIAEEKKNELIRREKRSAERKRKQEEKRRLEEELEAAKQNTVELEQRLFGLNDEKHELFMKLKCVLLTEENQKKLKQIKDNPIVHPSAALPAGPNTPLRSADSFHQHQPLKQSASIPPHHAATHYGQADGAAPPQSSAMTGGEPFHTAQASGASVHAMQPRVTPPYGVPHGHAPRVPPYGHHFMDQSPAGRGSYH